MENVINKESLIFVTGGAGFIGSNLVRHLNKNGYFNIRVIDDLTDSRKFRNLSKCKFSYQDKDEFWDNLFSNGLHGDLPDYVFHLGAISSTTHKNGKELMEENTLKSIDLIRFCYEAGIPIQYASSASVYGNSLGQDEDPLNAYAFSKLATDNFVRDLFYEVSIVGEHTKPVAPIIGLRYFNVYGPGENHKDGQSSPILSFWRQTKDKYKKVDVFKIESVRDFIHVDDVCKIHLFLLENSKPELSGIIDVGTGASTSFYDIAKLVVKAEWLNQAVHEDETASVVLTDLPQNFDLASYQYQSKANRGHLEAIGYTEPLLTVEEGVLHYVSWLESEQKKIDSVNDRMYRS